MISGPSIARFKHSLVDGLPTNNRSTSGKSSAIGLGKEGDEFITGLTEKLGATPPELYGRIYFDKKTGKPVDPEAQKVFNQAVSDIVESKKEIKSTPGIVSSGFAGLKKRK